jgi:hypothetical protein
MAAKFRMALTRRSGAAARLRRATPVTIAAVRPRLWGVQHCAAPASPRHVPGVTGARGCTLDLRHRTSAPARRRR